MRFKKQPLHLAALFAAVALAACGGDDGGSVPAPSPAPTPAPSPTPTPAPSPAPTPTPSPAPAPTPSPAPAPITEADRQNIAQALLRAVSRPAGTDFSGTLPFAAYYAMLKVREFNLTFHDISHLVDRTGVILSPEQDYSSVTCRNPDGKAWMERRYTIAVRGQKYSGAGDYVNLRYQNCVLLETSHLMLNGSMRMTLTRELRGHWEYPQGNQPTVHFRVDYRKLRRDWVSGNTPTGKYLTLDGHLGGTLNSANALGLPDIIDVTEPSILNISEPHRDDTYTDWTGQYHGSALKHQYTIIASGVAGMQVSTPDVVVHLNPVNPVVTPTAGTQMGAIAEGSVTVEYTQDGPRLR